MIIINLLIILLIKYVLSLNSHLRISILNVHRFGHYVEKGQLRNLSLYEVHLIGTILDLHCVNLITMV